MTRKDVPRVRRFVAKPAAVAVMSMVSTVVAAQACPPWLYIDEWVDPVFVAATQQLQAAITAMDTLLSTTLNLQSERLTSAIAVLTKQKAVTGNQIAETARATAQQTATAFQALAEAEQVKRARFDFGAEFGQGFSPCRVYATRQVIANRAAEMESERRERVMSEIVAAPGRYADPIATQHSFAAARTEFCTREQVGYNVGGQCTQEGALPGADLTVATLFEPAMEGEPLYDAKVSFVNHVAGLPDGPVPDDAAQSAAATSYAMAKSRRDALISPALTSLKEIQLDWSGVDSAHGGKDLPLGLYFRNEVRRYSGNSPDYDAWSKVLVGQNERGAMVELLKVTALDLALQERQYRQYERMEAQLASLVAMEINTSGVAAEAAAAAQDSAKGRTKQQVQ